MWQKRKQLSQQDFFFTKKAIIIIIPYSKDQMLHWGRWFEVEKVVSSVNTRCIHVDGAQPCE